MNYFVLLLLLLQFDATLVAIDYMHVQISWRYYFYNVVCCCATLVLLFLISEFFGQCTAWGYVLWSTAILNIAWNIFLDKKEHHLAYAIDIACIISGLLALVMYHMFLSYIKTQDAIGQIFS